MKYPVPEGVCGMRICHFLQIDAYFDQNMSCGSRLVCIFTIDHVRMTEYSAKPRPSKKVVMSTSGKKMLTCISMHNLIQIYCVVSSRVISDYCINTGTARY